MSTAVKGGWEEGVGAAIGERHICLPMKGNSFVGPYASCDHEVGGKAGAGSAHGVGEKADV